MKSASLKHFICYTAHWRNAREKGLWPTVSRHIIIMQRAFLWVLWFMYLPHDLIVTIFKIRYRRCVIGLVGYGLQVASGIHVEVIATPCLFSF